MSKRPNHTTLSYPTTLTQPNLIFTAHPTYPATIIQSTLPDPQHHWRPIPTPSTIPSTRHLTKRASCSTTIPQPSHRQPIHFYITQPYPNLSKPITHPIHDTTTQAHSYIPHHNHTPFTRITITSSSQTLITHIPLQPMHPLHLTSYTTLPYPTTPYHNIPILQLYYIHHPTPTNPHTRTLQHHNSCPFQSNLRYPTNPTRPTLPSQPSLTWHTHPIPSSPQALSDTVDFRFKNTNICNYIEISAINIDILLTYRYHYLKYIYL